VCLEVVSVVRIHPTGCVSCGGSAPMDDIGLDSGDHVMDPVYVVALPWIEPSQEDDSGGGDIGGR
jgi:hypothetical protein